MTKDITAKLKIGFVLDDGLDDPDGVQQYILTLGEWFKQNGHEIRYLVGESKRRDIPELIELAKNIKVSFNGNKLSIPLLPRWKKIKTTLQDEKFDVIHIQVPFSPVMGGRVLANVPKNTAVIGTFHILPLSDSLPYRLGNKATAASIRSGLARIDKLFSVSKPAQQFAKKTYKINSDVLGNPIKLSPEKSNKKNFNDTSNLTIVFLGRLVRRKGCLTLLKAIDNLDSELRGRVQVKIGGTGPDRKMLEDYINSNDLNKIVKFYGFIDEANKRKFLKESDIAIFPSTGGESFGIVLTEAMAANGPVVLAGDNPGYRSVLESDEALFDPHSYTDLSRQIIGYIKAPMSLNKVFEQQQRLVRKYDIDKIGETLLVNFASIVQNKNK